MLRQLDSGHHAYNLALGVAFLFDEEDEHSGHFQASILGDLIFGFIQHKKTNDGHIVPMRGEQERPILYAPPVVLLNQPQGPCDAEFLLSLPAGTSGEED